MDDFSVQIKPVFGQINVVKYSSIKHTKGGGSFDNCNRNSKENKEINDN